MAVIGGQEMSGYEYMMTVFCLGGGWCDLSLQKSPMFPISYAHQFKRW